MNIVMTGAGSFVEVQGTAEGARVHPRRAGRAARPGREGLRRPHQAAAGVALLVTPGCFLASRNAKKLAEMERILRRAPARRRSARSRRRDGVRRAGRGPAHVRGQRVAQGARRAWRRPVCRRSPTTRAVRGRAQRHAGRPLRAVVGAPEGRRPQQRLLLDQLADVPDERRGAHFVCAVAFCAAPGDEARRRTARCPAGSSARSAATGASATTWCSRPTTGPG